MIPLEHRLYAYMAGCFPRAWRIAVIPKNMLEFICFVYEDDRPVRIEYYEWDEGAGFVRTK